MKSKQPAIAPILGCLSGPASINAAICTDFFGPKNSGTNWGVAMLSLGFSSVLFHTISARFLQCDVTKTYIMAAVSAVIPIILMVIVSYLQNKIRSEEYSSQLAKLACE